MRIETNTFIIRSLEPTQAELDAVLEVYRQCEDFLALGPVPKASMEMVLADLALSKKEGGTFCGIYARSTDPSTPEQMLGIVDFLPTGFEHDPRCADLALLMIAAPYRDQGLGAAVVQAVEAEICRVGRAREIHSGVQVNNPGGIRFWQRMGYIIVTGAELMPDGTTAYQLRKDVPSVA